MAYTDTTTATTPNCDIVYEPLHAMGFNQQSVAMTVGILTGERIGVSDGGQSILDYNHFVVLPGVFDCPFDSLKLFARIYKDRAGYAEMNIETMLGVVSPFGNPMRWAVNFLGATETLYVKSPRLKIATLAGYTMSYRPYVRGGSPSDPYFEMKYVLVLYPYTDSESHVPDNVLTSQVYTELGSWVELV